MVVPSKTITLGTVQLVVIADPTKPDANDLPAFNGTYQAQETGESFPFRDHITSSLSKGAGIVRRTGPEDDGGYAWAENLITWTGDGAMPAGQMHDYSLTSVQNANGQGTVPINNATIVDIVEFLGHLWLIFDDVVAGAAAATIRIPNADPAQTSTYEPFINNGSFGSAATGFRLGYHSRGAEVFQTSGGAAALYVGTYNGTNSEIYECTAPNTWAASAAGGSGGTSLTRRVDKLRTVYWTALSETSGAPRMLAKVAPNVIRQCTAGSDPKLDASWTTPITIGMPDEEIQAIVAAPTHAYAVCNSGIYDFTDQRTRHLTPYWKMTRAMTAQAAAVTRGLPAMLYDDHIVASRGFGSMDRYPVTSDGYQQRITGECGVAYMQDGTPISRVWITAYCESGDGALLVAGFNPDNGTSYVGRFFDRLKVGIPGPGPYVQFWAEVAYPPVSGTSYMITAMRVTAPALAAGSTLASPKLYLWLGMTPSAGGQARLKYVEMGFGGGPLSIRASGGTSIAHASASATVPQTARLYMTGYQGGDMDALKVASRLDLSHQSISSGNVIGAYMRADGDPATLGTGGTWFHEGDSAAADTTKIVPASVTTGHMIYRKYEWSTATPFTTPARLQEERLRVYLRYEPPNVMDLWIRLGGDYQILNGGLGIQDAPTDWATVVGYQYSGPVALSDETPATHQALVGESIRYRRVLIDEAKNEWETIANVKIAILS